MKKLTKEAVIYMAAEWQLDQGEAGYDDIQAFWNEGHYELVALRLVQAGAVEGINSESENMIKVANSINFKQEQKLIDEALKEYFVLDCKHCNYVAFLDQYNADENQLTENCYSCMKKHESKPRKWSEIK